MATKGLRLVFILGAVLAIAGSSGIGDTGTSDSGDAVDPALLAAISQQVPVITDSREFQEAVTLAQATQVWIQQDLVLRSWPRYQDVREALCRELSQTMDLDRSTVAELRDEAARLRAIFWQEEGSLSADGYRNPYKAQVLLEIARGREPTSLALSDDLVETILTSHPLDCYDPETKDRLENPEVALDLRTLRTENYTQIKSEVEQGRAFAWEDFARVADFVQLWSGPDPQKAAEAFEWGLSQVGPSLKGSDYETYSVKVLAEIRSGGGVGFGIYLRLGAKYPHDYLYARRLPSFQGPDPEGNELTPMLGIGSPAKISFGS